MKTRTPAFASALAGIALLAGPVVAQQVARSADGMVVAAHPLATEVGASTLEQGGNAVDAAVATAFALAVVEPAMSGIGGRVQILLRTGDGQVYGLDATTQVPAAYRWDPDADNGSMGFETIGIPGAVAGLAKVLEDHGSLPLADLIAPAVRLAEDGFALLPEQAARLRDSAADLRQNPGAAALFLRPDGTPYGAGDRLRQPQLARTLRAIAEGGPDAFYRGEIARAIAADMESGGSTLRLADLESYQAVPAVLVRGEARGRELIGTFSPASGATSIEALQILDRTQPPLDDEVRWADLVARALLRGFADRAEDIPASRDRAAWLTSDSLAERHAASILAGDRLSFPAESPAEPEHTTHLSAADRWGNAIALTQTIGPSFGSRVATEQLGFLYASTMGYLGRLEPGDRASSSISPLLILRDGELEHVLGAAGGRRIISAVVQTAGRALFQEMPLVLAMDAPRLHPDTAEIFLENRPVGGWSQAEVDALAALGWDVDMRSPGDRFGRIHALHWDAESREWVGIADPRWQGTARAPAAVPDTDATAAEEDAGGP